ncbi:MAG: GGDEF domain-containing protein [Spirochaetaceae bacterium]|nr:MAG: GGDEF domain-containing protein [Spirochaetaceae bacterium]
MKLNVANDIAYSRPTFFTAIVVVSIVTILLFPLFTIFHQYPNITRLLEEFTLNEAVGVAKYLSTFIIAEEDVLGPNTFGKDIVAQIQRVERDAHFIRLVIYSPSGQILYSSEPGEIGEVNRDPYFRQMTVDPKVVAKEVQRGGRSLEDRYMTVDVVEAYVPIIREGNLTGVFEIYYDISSEKQKLRSLISLSSVVLFGMAAVLLIAVFISVSRANQYLRDRQRVLEELRTLSLSDELTGLYNRRGFFILAEQQIKIASRTRRGMLLVSADLDGLKKINDSFGHHEGDRAIVDAGQILRQSFRESDIISRIGGDEFVILIPEKPEINAEVLFARLKKNLEAHNVRVHRPYTFSISMGVATFDPLNPATLNELLVAADKSMYQNKKHYRNRPKTERTDPAS